MKFFTKYNLPVRVLKHYDDSDNVDRLSFCDTTLQIKRFMLAGSNLRLNRAQTLYHSVNDVLNDELPVAPPVYVQDSVIADSEKKIVTDVLASRQAAKTLVTKPTIVGAVGSGSNGAPVPDVASSPLEG